MDHAVGPCDLKLHSSDESSLPRRLEVPYEERGGQCRSTPGIDEAHIGTRLDFEAQCRIQISVRSGRPLPDGVLGQLAIRLLVQHTAADVSSCLCVEKPDRSGIGSLADLLRWLWQLRLEQLRFDHAAGCCIGTPQLAADSPQADHRN